MRNHSWFSFRFQELHNRLTYIIYELFAVTSKIRKDRQFKVFMVKVESETRVTMEIFWTIGMQENV